MPKSTISNKAIRELRTSDQAVGLVMSMAEQVADRCGDGYVARTSKPRNRARAAVITATGKAIRSNARHNTLVRALMGGVKA